MGVGWYNRFLEIQNQFRNYDLILTSSMSSILYYPFVVFFLIIHENQLNARDQISEGTIIK